MVAVCKISRDSLRGHIMTRAFKIVTGFILVGFMPLIANADCDMDVADYVGWTIAHKGTVTGYVDSDGSRDDNFHGCTYDRIILIDDNKAVTCDDYNYGYAYRPDIVILKRNWDAVACIDDEVMDIEMEW